MADFSKVLKNQIEGEDKKSQVLGNREHLEV